MQRKKNTSKWRIVQLESDELGIHKTEEVIEKYKVITIHYDEDWNHEDTYIIKPLDPYVPFITMYPETAMMKFPWEFSLEEKEEVYEGFKMAERVIEELNSRRKNN